MKTTLYLAAVLAALVLVSCSKEQNGIDPDQQKARLAVNLAGVISPASRAVEEPGDSVAGTIKLTSGQIFVLSQDDRIYYQEPLSAELLAMAAQIANGMDDGSGRMVQVLGKDVPSDSRIYIVGNIPTGVATTTLQGFATLDDILKYEALMTTQGVYTGAALANVNGEPVLIELDEEAAPDTNPSTGDTVIEATVTVYLNPLISRIELGKITGSEEISAFTVTGVYVDDWYSKFTFGGLAAGALYEQFMNTDFHENLLASEGSWPALGTPLVSTPDDTETPLVTELRAFNVAPGGLPRLIIRLEDVTYTADTDGDPDTPDETVSEDVVYLTVTGYTNLNGTATTDDDSFMRGKIYNIGGGPDGDGIIFDYDDLHLTPNPGNVTLEVEVKITEWVIENPGAVLQQ